MKKTEVKALIGEIMALVSKIDNPFDLETETKSFQKFEDAIKPIARLLLDIDQKRLKKRDKNEEES